MALCGFCRVGPEPLTLHGADADSRKGSKAHNVLLVVVDDLNTDLGCYGHPRVHSPNIDRLAARGVRFDRAYCQYALCNPSRTSLLSGRRPETSGVYDLKTRARSAMPDAVMLPQLFRQNGYFCAGAGKVHHGLNHREPESWDFYVDGQGEDSGEQAALAARYTGKDGTPRAYPLEGNGSKTRDGMNAKIICDLLEEHGRTKAPFFLALGFHKPHLPWTAPQKFFDLYPVGSLPEPVSPSMSGVPSVALQTELSGFAPPESRTEAMRGYYACVSFTDENLGVLMEALETHGLWETTVVVLLSDNGFHLGDHDGLWAKFTLFENATRVPLIFAGAGVPRGVVVRDPVELLDVYPTLTELTGVPAPSGLEGRSLIPLMRGSASGLEAKDRRAFSLVHHYDRESRSDVLGRSVRTSSYRYTEWETLQTERELYLANDPGEETVNVQGRPETRALQREGEQLLRDRARPKTGAVQRPRALLEGSEAGENRPKVGK